jgi:hypothetical protein
MVAGWAIGCRPAGTRCSRTVDLLFCIASPAVNSCILENQFEAQRSFAVRTDQLLRSIGCCISVRDTLELHCQELSLPFSAEQAECICSLWVSHGSCIIQHTLAIGESADKKCRSAAGQ